MTPVMTRFLEAAAEALPGDAAATLRADRARRARPGRRPTARSTGCATRCTAARSRALIRDTLSPNVVHAGVKYNVIPGDAIDRGRLPHPAGHDARPTSSPRSSGASARTSCRACRIERLALGRPGRGAGRGPAVGHAGRHAARPRPRRRPAPGHGARSRPMPRRRRWSARRPTASRRSASSPTSASSSASMASTSGSRSTRCGSGYPVLYDVVRRFCG